MYRIKDDKLLTLSKEELSFEIKSTKRGIERLKHKMEAPDYRGSFMCPTNDVILKCDREYLKKAISRYIELGGDYELDNIEQKAIEFNNDLQFISKITLLRRRFTGIETKVVLNVKEEGSELLVDDCKMETDAFLDKYFIISDIQWMYMEEWKEFYSSEDYNCKVVDGEEWELTLEYSTGKERKYAGLNSYPFSYNELLKMLKQEERYIL